MMPPLLAQVPATETVRTLVFLGGGTWLDVAVWLLGFLVVLLTLRNHRRLLPVRRRVFMVGLRALLVGVLIGFYYQPAFLEERVAVSRNAVLIAADTSESMALAHGGQTRSDRIATWFQANRDALADLAGGRELHFFTLGDALGDLPSPLDQPAEVVPALAPRAHASRIGQAVRDLKDRFRNQDVGGVILLTDGIDTSSDGRRSALSPELADAVRDLGAPISALTVAGDPTLKDVAVIHIGSSSFAFLLNATTLEATLEVHGYPAGDLLVRLLEDDQEVAQTVVALDPASPSVKARFEFVPKQLGKHVYTVVADTLPDEIYAKNNRRSTIMTIVRDKIRVVQVVGQPSWDERHLRNLLKENPNVDLVSFFILANRFSFRPLSPRETSLIPFPSHELFEEELGGFDLLIFQNFDYGPYQTREYLPNIAKFVREGGAFAMVGGALSFTAGGYYGTELADILPVDLPPGFGVESTTDTGSFSPTLTEAGATHPVTRLLHDPAANRALWRDLFPLEGTNLVTRAKPDAVTLLTHPARQGNDGKPMPVLAVREADKGRTLALTTDSSWFWNMKGGLAGADAHAYQAFWDNAIRWLIRDPELDLLKVRALSDVAPLGDSVDVVVTAWTPDYRPLANAPLAITVRRREAATTPGEGGLILTPEGAKTDAQGNFRLTVPVEATGVFEVTVQADLVPGRTTTARDLFIGVDQSPELERVIGDGRLLGALAKASGGAVLGFDAKLADVPLEAPTVMRVKSRSHRDLWAAPWALGLAVALFGLEWWLRRRFGYL